MSFLTRVLAFAFVPALMQSSSGGHTAQAPEKAPLAWASVAIHVSSPERAGQDYSNDQPNGLTEHGIVLKDLISQGYHFSVMPFRDEEITGLPDWARSTRYDIVARVDPENVPEFKKISDLPVEELITDFAARRPTGEMLMVRDLLAERFNLKVHWESKEQSVYALVLAKGGLRMKPSADSEHGRMNFSHGHLSGKHVPISFLASLLALPAERTVLDRTALPGAFDFELHFDPRDSSGGKPSDDPDFFTAIQEQLGLRLQSTRAAVPVLVVDHVEPPSPN